MTPLECVCQWLEAPASSIPALLAQLEAHTWCTGQQCYESVDDAIPMAAPVAAPQEATYAALTVALLAAIVWHAWTRASADGERGKPSLAACPDDHDRHDHDSGAGVGR